MNIEELRISRRHLLTVGVTATTTLLAATAPTRLLAASDEISQAPKADRTYNIRYIVTDRRHAQSLGFAEGHGAKGAERLEVTEGLTRLWQERLEPLWTTGEGAVAGLTTRAVWECLAEQARSHSLRTRAMSELVPRNGQADSLVSWIIA